jgi:hypothetical protein
MDLLRADVFRLRRRPEIWLLLLIIPLGAAFGFLTAYFAIPGQFFNSDPTAPPVPEIAIEQAEYFFPSSIFRALDDATWVIVAAFFVTATSIGAEYSWGTIRTALLARSDRGRFLSSRVTAIAGICLALVAMLLVVGVFMPVVLTALGEHQAADPPIQPDLIPAIASRLVGIAFTIALAAFVTVITRNAALTILVALVYVVAELLIGSNPALHQSDVMAAIVRGLPIASIAGLLGDASTPGAALQASPDPNYLIADYPLWVSFAVALAWTALLVGGSIALIRRADIRE